MSLFRKFAKAIFVPLCIVSLCGPRFLVAVADEPVDRDADAPPQLLAITSLPNALRVHENFISGGQPTGPDGFAALQQLGVRTIISVDAAIPNVKLARAYGLRYVHLPHGYDGIPDNRVVELATAITTLPTPIYIHCHHGKHRSPAAAAVAGVAAGLLSHETAQAVLTLAGTSEDYRGLHQVVASAKPLEQLRGTRIVFEETVRVPPLAASMALVERRFDHLTIIQRAGWQTPRTDPDLSPGHEALMLREHLTELLRTKEVRDREPRFRQILQHSRKQTFSLEKQLAANADLTSTDAKSTLSATLASIRADCKSCHRLYRD